MQSPYPAARTVDVLEVLDASPNRRLIGLVASLAGLSQIVDGFDLQAIAFVAPKLLSEWGLKRPDLGPVLAAGLVGMAIGAFVLGNFGDRRGRRRALLVSLGIVTVMAFASAYAQNLTQLAVCRLLTGIGLGGVIPNSTAMMMEFAPRRLRNLLVSITVVGVPFGGVVGAEIAVHVLPAYGWRAVFVIGALLPALLLAALWKLLPESPRYMTLHPEHHGALAQLLNDACGQSRYSASDHFVLPEGGAQSATRPGVGALLNRAFRRDTLALWLVFFANTFAVYSFFSWLPVVLTSAGLPITIALRGAQLCNLGAVPGAVLMAFGMNRFGSRPVLIAVGVISVTATAALGLIPIVPQAEGAWASGVAPLLMVMTVAGAAVLGFQVAMYSVASHVYPTIIRATGVGWSLGVARLGGILSSVTGGVLLSFAHGTQSFFFGVAAVLTVTVAGVLLVRTHLRRA